MTVESEMLQKHRAYRIGGVVYFDTGRSMPWAEFVDIHVKAMASRDVDSMIGGNVVRFPKRRENRQPCDVEG